MACNNTYLIRSACCLPTTMWPPAVQRQFEIGDTTFLQNVIHAPSNKVLHTLFPAESNFTVVPNFEERGSYGPEDCFITLEIYADDKPVLIVSLHRERDLKRMSKRAEVDLQMRRRLSDLIGESSSALLRSCARRLKYRRRLSLVNAARHQRLWPKAQTLHPSHERHHLPGCGAV